MYHTCTIQAHVHVYVHAKKYTQIYTVHVLYMYMYSTCTCTCMEEFMHKPLELNLKIIFNLKVSMSSLPGIR